MRTVRGRCLLGVLLILPLQTMAVEAQTAIPPIKTVAWATNLVLDDKVTVTLPAIDVRDFNWVTILATPPTSDDVFANPDVVLNFGFATQSSGTVRNDVGSCRLFSGTVRCVVIPAVAGQVTLPAHAVRVGGNFLVGSIKAGSATVVSIRVFLRRDP